METMLLKLSTAENFSTGKNNYQEELLQEFDRKSLSQKHEAPVNPADH